jgi:PhzF family phenazine biosynthesis protein
MTAHRTAMNIKHIERILMTSLPYFHVDAFASTAFAGNQAAVMPLSAWLPDETLQAIAQENNFAETAFIVADKTGDTDFELRWFTPQNEVPLCGHATLASAHIILSQDADMDIVTFQTRKAGILLVERQDSGYSMALPAYPPSSAEMPDWISAIGGVPVEHYFYPGRYNVLRYQNAAEILALTPDFKTLAAMGNDDQYICTAPGEGHVSGADVVSRVFVPGCGVDEDSVTGSAHAVLTPYWAEKLGRNNFTAYQASARGGHVGCRLNGDKAVLSGDCVTVVEGVFRL